MKCYERLMLPFQFKGSFNSLIGCTSSDVDVVVLIAMSNVFAHSCIVGSITWSTLKHKLMTFKDFHASKISKKGSATFNVLRMPFNGNLTQAINIILINYDFCDIVNNDIQAGKFRTSFRCRCRSALNISLIVTLFLMIFHLVEDPFINIKCNIS